MRGTRTQFHLILHNSITAVVVAGNARAVSVAVAVSFLSFHMICIDMTYTIILATNTHHGYSPSILFLPCIPCLSSPLERREAEEEEENRMDEDEGEEEDDMDQIKESSSSMVPSGQRGKASTSRSSVSAQRERAAKWAAENLKCKSSSSSSGTKVRSPCFFRLVNFLSCASLYFFMYFLFYFCCKMMI